MSRFPNHGWRSVVRADSDHIVYRRPLANTELGFYWDSVFSGTAITINHIKINAEKEFEHALFSELNIKRAWIRMKRRFPLLGASVEELPGSDVVEFVVDEASLRTLRTEEVHQTEAENEEDIDRLVEHLHNGPSPLSNEVIAQIWIARLKDVPHRYHLVMCATHFITDGVAGTTMVRDLLQELSALSDREDVDGPPLPERLATLLSIEDLGPLPYISPARRRWREITGKVILNIRQAKLTGGQSLPTVPQADLGKPAYSRTTALRLPEDVSERIIRSCRSRGITFGSALPVFSQLAISRVLHRRRFRVDENGKPLIDNDEWEYRRRQPMHFGGPVNFRPYLNRGWYESGGAGEVCLAITFSFSVLPFMPAQDAKSSTAIGGDETRSDNVPSFSALLSPERFLYRALLANAQTKAQLKHPLFFEIHNARTPRRVSLGRAAGLAWREKHSEAGGSEVKVPSTYNQSPCVLTNSGSSFGNRDSTFPYDYPYALTSDSGSKSNVHVIDTATHLRCRPSELYLGALTQRKQLIFFTYADLNVYDESTVREWLGEVRDAAVHYLGGETPTISRY